MLRRVAALALVTMLACAKPPTEGALRANETDRATPSATVGSAPPPLAPASAPSASSAVSAAPTTPAPPSRSATSSPLAGQPPPNVKVVTIGMHVAGGPFDEPTKEPFKRAVEPHFSDLARCWAYVPKPKQADAGVDLLIEAGGGRAKVTNPRSTIEGEGFLPCVVSFFERIEFDKPKNGKTGVSYSVRFYP